MHHDANLNKSGITRDHATDMTCTGRQELSCSKGGSAQAPEVVLVGVALTNERTYDYPAPHNRKVRLGATASCSDASFRRYSYNPHRLSPPAASSWGAWLLGAAGRQKTWPYEVPSPRHAGPSGRA